MFDKDYWEQHWQHAGASPPNPYLERETGQLVPGTALDAGCGAGAEAIWLAEHGWQVTAADISSEALAKAGGDERVRWVEADLSVWQPGTQFDLVMTHYAHPAMPQLEFYDRIAEWVAPGGTLLIVGHSRNEHAETSAAAIKTRLDEETWETKTAEECERALHGHLLHDAVVRATKKAIR